MAVNKRLDNNLIERFAQRNSFTLCKELDFFFFGTLGLATGHLGPPAARTTRRLLFARSAPVPRPLKRQYLSFRGSALMRKLPIANIAGRILFRGARSARRRAARIGFRRLGFRVLLDR